MLSSLRTTARLATKSTTTTTTTTTRILVPHRREKHTLPDLPYAYDSLEPAISREIMTLHHGKHHATYVTNLNAAEDALKAAIGANDVRAIIANQGAIKFHGGGHLNHGLFWENLAPGGKGLREGSALGAQVTAQYGSVEALIKQVNGALAGIQGSGWAWLVKDKADARLKIVTTANQDPVTQDTVLIGIDAWEHAYYLQYENAKVKYFDAIWSVINWEVADERYSK